MTEHVMDIEWLHQMLLSKPLALDTGVCDDLV